MSAAGRGLPQGLISVKKNGKESFFCFEALSVLALCPLSGAAALGDRFGGSVVPPWHSTAQLSRFGADLGWGQWPLSLPGPWQLCTQGQAQV